MLCHFLQVIGIYSISAIKPHFSWNVYVITEKDTGLTGLIGKTFYVIKTKNIDYLSSLSETLCNVCLILCISINDILYIYSYSLTSEYDALMNYN